MSVLESILAYLRERSRPRLFIPLSMVLALSGTLLVAPWSPSPAQITIATLQALGLILAFRVWDDLEDRDVDRVRYPHRVVASATTLTPFYLLGVVLSASSIASLVAEPMVLRRLAGLLLAATVLIVWYRARSPRWRRHALGEYVLGMKYPLIAYAVAPNLTGGAITGRVVSVLFVLYLLICAYEYADDAELRHIFTSRRSIS